MNKKAVLMVGLGGAVGTFIRFSLFQLLTLQTLFITVLCNVMGAFLLAGLYTYLTNLNLVKKKAKHQQQHIKLFFGVGLLGSFTTFSTISYDFFRIFEAQSPFKLMLYLLFTFCGGLLATAAGIIFTNKLLIRREGV